MLDFSWAELSLIALIALFVIGPKDLPKVLRTLGRWMGMVRGMAKEFQQNIEEAVRETELEDVKKEFDDLSRLDVKKQIRKTVDPSGELDKAMSPFTYKPSKPSPDKAVAAPPAATNGSGQASAAKPAAASQPPAPRPAPEPAPAPASAEGAPSAPKTQAGS